MSFKYEIGQELRWRWTRVKVIDRQVSDNGRAPKYHVRQARGTRTAWTSEWALNPIPALELLAEAADDVEKIDAWRPVVRGN